MSESSLQQKVQTRRSHLRDRLRQKKGKRRNQEYAHQSQQLRGEINMIEDEIAWINNLLEEKAN